MKKTIKVNYKLLLKSILLFSCFFATFGIQNVFAKSNESITVYSNIYNAANVIDTSFKYEIIPDSDNPSGAYNEPESLIVNFDGINPDGTLTTKTGLIDFGKTVYSEPGLYKYVVREISNSSSEYEISSEKYEIYVLYSTVGKNVYQQAKNLDNDEKGNINFNHEPIYSYIRINLNTIGDYLDKQEYFRFELDFDSLCIGCKYDIYGQDEYITYNGQTIKTINAYTVAQKSRPIVLASLENVKIAKNNSSPTYIYLKSGQGVTVGLSSDEKMQIPIGTKLTIIGDENLNTRKWTMTIDGEKVMSKDFIIGGDYDIQINLARNMLIPNTGIFSEAWPYIFLVIVGFIGSYGFWKLKKDAR